MKKNQIIDHIVTLLQGLKEEEQPKNLKVALSHGMISLTAEIDRKNKRVSITSEEGQTVLDLSKRKPETIEGMGHIFIEAAKLARQ